MGDNQLARGGMEVGGQHLSLQDVKSDAYVVGAVNEHIVPWQASYNATRLLGGNVRYVLSDGGLTRRLPWVAVATRCSARPRRLHPRLIRAPAGSTQPLLDKSTKARSISSRSQTRGEEND